LFFENDFAALKQEEIAFERKQEQTTANWRTNF
jgi:hypothetical protein